MDEEKIKIIKLLKGNGFEREDTNHYIHEGWSVDLSSDEIFIANSSGYETFIPMNYYAMFGVMTAYRM